MQKKISPLWALIAARCDEEDFRADHILDFFSKLRDDKRLSVERLQGALVFFETLSKVQKDFLKQLLLLVSP